MQILDLKEKPVWQMTGEELLHLLNHSYEKDASEIIKTKEIPSKDYVYGIRGIAKLFGCSLSTANKIKREGKIDKAIIQQGRTIITDSELALQLYAIKK